MQTNTTTALRLLAGELLQCPSRHEVPKQRLAQLLDELHARLARAHQAIEQLDSVLMDCSEGVETPLPNPSTAQQGQPTPAVNAFALLNPTQTQV